MDRRTFCQWMGIGLIANSLPMALAACTSKNAKSAATGNFQEVGTLAQLDSEGQILNQQIPNNPILVVRNQASPETLVAVNPICSHRECPLNWNKDENVFVCGCHDSKFDTSGHILNPPAHEPLTLYPVKVEGDRILVSVEV